VIRLRRATPADLPALAAVFVASWQGGYRGVVPDDVLDAVDEAAATAELAADADAPDRSTVVALDAGGAIVGFARYGPARAPAEPGAGYLASLYVHPRAGGQGVGQQLLGHVLDELAGRPVLLDVFCANTRARHLYERAGFRPVPGSEYTDPRWQAPQLRYRRAGEVACSANDSA
jgi:ribosomal protein S18 acetylase RimI-like enzyme